MTKNTESCSNGPLTVRNSILAHDHPGHRWVQPGCFPPAGICSQGIRGRLSLASSPLPRCIVLRGADEAGLTFSWRILSSASLSEKCSTLVSCRSISVSHTRMLSLVPSNSSLWLVKCCQRRGEYHVCFDGTRAFRQTARLFLAKREGYPQRPTGHQGAGAGSGAWALVLAV